MDGRHHLSVVPRVSNRPIPQTFRVPTVEGTPVNIIVTTTVSYTLPTPTTKGKYVSTTTVTTTPSYCGRLYFDHGRYVRKCVRRHRCVPPPVPKTRDTCVRSLPPRRPHPSHTSVCLITVSPHVCIYVRPSLPSTPVGRTCT